MRSFGTKNEGQRYIVFFQPLLELSEFDLIVAIVVEFVENVLDFLACEVFIHPLQELPQLVHVERFVPGHVQLREELGDVDVVLDDHLPDVVDQVLRPVLQDLRGLDEIRESVAKERVPIDVVPGKAILFLVLEAPGEEVLRFGRYLGSRELKWLVPDVFEELLGRPGGPRSWGWAFKWILLPKRAS